MSVDRDTALAFMTALRAADLATTDAMMSEDAIWSFQLGMPQASLPAPGGSGPRAKHHAASLPTCSASSMPTASRSDDADDRRHPRIAIEYEACGRTSRGTVYPNYHVTTLTIENGKLTEIRPYNDTAHMLAAFGG